MNNNRNTYLEFKQLRKGLYYLDMTNQSVVFAIKTFFFKAGKKSESDLARAQNARNFQEIIAHPSLKDLLYIVDNKLVQNCQVRIEDVKTAEDILGPSVANLKKIKEGIRIKSA